jgi:hypothetical protein
MFGKEALRYFRAILQICRTRVDDWDYHTGTQYIRWANGRVAKLDRNGEVIITSYYRIDDKDDNLNESAPLDYTHMPYFPKGVAAYIQNKHFKVRGGLRAVNSKVANYLEENKIDIVKLQEILKKFRGYSRASISDEILGTERDPMTVAAIGDLQKMILSIKDRVTKQKNDAYKEYSDKCRLLNEEGQKEIGDIEKQISELLNSSLL